MLHLQPEPERLHPPRDRGQLTEARLHFLVHGDPLLMLADLFPGQPGHVARIAQLVEEQLQLGDVAHLKMLVGGGGQPLPQRVPAHLGEAVGLRRRPPSSGWTASSPIRSSRAGSAYSCACGKGQKQPTERPISRFRSYGVDGPRRPIMPSTTYEVVESRPVDTARILLVRS